MYCSRILIFIIIRFMHNRYSNNYQNTFKLIYIFVCACVCVCVRACVRVCVCVCVRVCTRCYITFATVIDFMACNSNPCQHGGKCYKLGQGYVCSCSGNYGGRSCSSRYFQTISVSILHVPVNTLRLTLASMNTAAFKVKERFVQRCELRIL